MSIKFIAIAAVTLDGKIARHKSHMSDWTSKEDKVFMRSLLDKCDAIIVGNNTYKTAIEPLSKRNCIVFSKFKKKRIRKLENPTYINPQKFNIRKFIRSCGYKKIAILGGAQTYTYCLQNNLLDEFYLTVEPVVFGKGITLFAGDVQIDKKFKLISIKKLNKSGTLLLRYKK